MKATITLLLLCMTLGVQAQTLQVFGQVEEEITSVTVSTFNAETISYDELKTSTIKGGKYQFELQLTEPTLYQLKFSNAKRVLMAFEGESKVEVNYKTDQIEINGSEASKDMQAFDQQNGQLQQKHFAQLKKDADAAMKSGDQSAMADIQKRSAEAIQAFLPELRAWIESKGVGPAGYHALQYSDFNKELDYISSQLDKFEREIPNSPITKALAAQVYRSKVLSPGQVPPAFDAVDLNGNTFSYQQFKGKVLLVDFWAAWCRACRIENPQFVELYKSHNQNGFEIVSISQDRDDAVWKQAIEKDGVGLWTNIQDKNKAITELYAVSSLPQNLVLNKEGKIIGKNVSAKELEKILAEYL